MTIVAALALFLAQDQESIEIRVTVGNFCKDWDSGAWDITYTKGDKFAKLRYVLTPEKGEKREYIGEVALDKLKEALAGLAKKGLFKLKDAPRCKCDAPQFAVSAKEGKTENAFTFGHSHEGRDEEQKAVIDVIIALVEKHATTAVKK